MITLEKVPTESSYQFNISATDSMGLLDIAVADITVTDLNDNIPEFLNCSAYAPEVSEDAPFGTTVLQVSHCD